MFTSSFHVPVRIARSHSVIHQAGFPIFLYLTLLFKLFHINYRCYTDLSNPLSTPFKMSKQPPDVLSRAHIPQWRLFIFSSPAKCFGSHMQLIQLKKSFFFFHGTPRQMPKSLCWDKDTWVRYWPSLVQSWELTGVLPCAASDNGKWNILQRPNMHKCKLFNRYRKKHIPEAITPLL